MIYFQGADMHNKEAVQLAISSAQKPKETQTEVITRLASLSALEYDRVRDHEAKALGVRVSVLDKEISLTRQVTPQSFDMFPTIQPWENPVDGAELLTEIYNTIKRFIVCDDKTVVATTLWIAFTWFIDNVQVAPLAVITAPEKRCGKSQLLDLIGRLSRRPLVASNISPSAVYRVIEAQSPTLLIDEADAFLRDNEEIRGILNSGHTRQSAYVIRVVGEDYEPQQFSTWGAKAISGIGTLADTLMDRSIVLELRRKLKHENVERLRHADKWLFKRLASKLARYADDNGLAIESSRPILPEELNDRAQDNWEPLLAIADYVGGEWPQRARDAALGISGIEHDSASLSTELLMDIKEIFDTKGCSRMSTADLIDELTADDMKPWATYNKGKPITPRQLAKRLGEFGIKPQTIRMSGRTPKGFMLDAFQDAFKRYIPSDDSSHLSATPQHDSNNLCIEPVSNVADYSRDNT
ncbi:MAG: hypothetical protein A3J37_07265 [Alphaproteobacteria bacterium RIFCSPHIGHO2_12_FULL_45_9]|nr:MAG: hypothetical protein A3B66_04765 [Alphaproteobacteria bacterium RIFCSPHIGHO2_02_FULL_46_13]OFW96860.1 MAG: hypothetical protein A3J37_07265 [Alphaproteobacteria bacterium RIFCSPHIGHO2_12_FULL_45_9]